MSAAVFLVAVCHFLLLFNTGIYFDGWMLLHWLSNDLWRECLEFYSRLGMPAMAYWYWAAGKLLPFPLAYKILSFVFLTAGTALLFDLFRRAGVLTPEERFWLLALSFTQPIWVTVIEPTHFCYHTGYFLFLLSAWLLVVAETRSGVQGRVVRAASALGFFLSFNYNALLTCFYSVWALWLFFLRRRGKIGPSLREGARYVFLSRGIFTFLPIFFWIHKTIFTPVHGDQVGYNSLTLGREVMAPLVRLPYVFQVHLVDCVRSFGESPQGLLAVLLATLLVWLGTRYGRSDQPRAGGLAPLLVGGWLLVGAAFPYLVTLKGFSLGLNGDRMNFLLTLPVALLGFGLVRVLTPGRLRVFGQVIFATVIATGLVRSVERYGRWQVRAIKDEAVAQVFSAHKLLDRARVFAIEDRFQWSDRWDDRYWYIGHQPTYMLGALGGGIRWLGVPQKEIVDVKPPYSTHVLTAFVRKFKLTYFVAGVDLTGAQGVLQLGPAAAFADSWHLVEAYYRWRFFHPEGLPRFLLGLVEWRFTPLPG